MGGVCYICVVIVVFSCFCDVLCFSFFLGGWVVDLRSTYFFLSFALFPGLGGSLRSTAEKSGPPLFPWPLGGVCQEGLFKPDQVDPLVADGFGPLEGSDIVFSPSPGPNRLNKKKNAELEASGLVFAGSSLPGGLNSRWPKATDGTLRKLLDAFLL